MSSTRVELRISFFVSSDRDAGREAAENAIRQIEYLATHGQLDDCYDFEVTKGSVNGNGWEDRWPSTPQGGASAETCGAYSRWAHWGGVLGPCIKDAGHGTEWHEDPNGATWDPAKWDARTDATPTTRRN